MPSFRLMLQSQESVLVLGAYRQTLAVVRSLAAAGYRVVLAREGGERTHVESSRAVSEVWSAPEGGAKEYLDALEALLTARPDIRYVFPIGEGQLETVCAGAEQLSPRAALVSASPETVRTCLDKARTYQLARSLGLPCGNAVEVSTWDALEAAVTSLGLPCVVKPNSSFTTVGGKKARLLRTGEGLAALRRVWDGRAPLLVQRFVEGARHNCHFVADAGKIIAYFEQRVHRTDAADGSGYCVDGESIPPTHLRELATKLVEALAYSGAGCVQFLVDDRAGEVCFLELNPRLDANVGLAVRCGMDLPRLALAYAAYQMGWRREPPAAPSEYATGVRGVWSSGEVQYLVWQFGAARLGPKDCWRRMRALARSWAQADAHLTFSWRDPLPSAAFFKKVAKELAVRSLRRARGIVVLPPGEEELQNPREASGPLPREVMPATAEAAAAP